MKRLKALLFVTFLLWPLSLLPQQVPEAKLKVKLPPLLFVGEETLKAELKGKVSLPSFLPPVQRQRPTLRVVDVDRGLADVIERPSPRPKSPGCAYSTAVGASVARILKGVEARYKRGLYLYLKGERGKAKRAFEGVVQGHPKTLYASMSLYWLGEMAIEEGRLEEALGLFGEILEHYAGSPYEDYAYQAAAWILMEENRWDEALRILERFRKEIPQSPLVGVAQLWEALISAKRGDWERCLQVAHELRERGGFKDEALYLMGLSSFSLGCHQDAVEFLKTFLVQNPEHPLREGALCLLGLAKLALGDLQGARGILESYLSTYPQGAWSGTVRAGLVRVLLDMGREGEARDQIEALRSVSPLWYGEALFDYALFLLGRDEGKALGVLREILEGHPKGDLYQRANYLMGEILARRCHYPEAARAFREASRGSGELALYASINLGLALLHAGDPSEAVRIWKGLLDRLGGKPLLRDRVRFFLGNGYLALGDPKGALGHLRTIEDPQLRKKGFLALAWYYFERERWGIASQWALKAGGGEGKLIRGLCLFNLKAYDEALGVLRELEEVEGGEELKKRAIFYEGLCLYKLGRFLEAAGKLEEFAKAFPDDPLLPQALYWRGWALSRAGRWEEAEIPFLKLASEYPKHPLAPEAWLRVGDARYNRGLYDSAVLAYLKVKVLYPSSRLLPDAFWGIILSYFGAGKEERFLLWADHFIRTYPDHPLAERVMLLLGEYYEGKGKVEEAKRYYRRIAEAFPASDEAKVHLGRLLGKEGALEEALRVLKEVKGKPHVWEALMEMAELSFRADRKEASLYLSRLVYDAPEEFALRAALFADRVLKGEATTYLLAVLGRFPHSESAPLLMVKLGEHCLEEGKQEEALGWFLKASRQSRQDAFRARCELKVAEVLLRMDRRSEALEQALKVLYLYPKQEEEKALALLLAAEIYRVQGEPERWRQACRRALELSGSKEVLKKAEEVCPRERR